MIRSTRLMLMSAALVLSTSCDGSSGTYESGVDPSRTLGSLSPAERDRVCRATTSSYSKLANSQQFETGMCRYQGLLFASVQGGVGGLTPAQQVEQCRALYNQCASMLDRGGGQPKAPSCDFGPCSNARVGDFESCGTEMAQGWLDLFDALPDCSGLANGGDPFEDLDLDVVGPSCESVLSCFNAPTSTRQPVQ